MLPVPNMVPNYHTDDSIPEVERVEIHVVCIHQTGAMIIHNNGAAPGSLRFARAVGFDAVQPGRIGSYIVDRSEVDTCAAIIV